MADLTTIARPYARAIFEHAVCAQQLAPWSAKLYQLAEVVLNPLAKDFINNPDTTMDAHSKLLLSVCGKCGSFDDEKVLKNVVDLLAHHKRLLALPDIYLQFEALRASHEKTLIANVSSFAPLSKAQEEKLSKTLSHRLQRKVVLEVSIDPSLLGGAVIRAGDLVIDGSVRGKLGQLNRNLAV